MRLFEMAKNVRHAVSMVSTWYGYCNIYTTTTSPIRRSDTVCNDTDHNDVRYYTKNEMQHSALH